METQTEKTEATIPSEIAEIIEKQGQILDDMSNHLVTVNEAMAKATALLTAWTPPPKVIETLKELAHQAYEESHFESELISDCFKWLDLFPKEDS